VSASAGEEWSVGESNGVRNKIVLECRRTSTGNSWMADENSPPGNRRVLSVMSAGGRFLCSNSCFLRLLLLPMQPPYLYAVGHDYGHGPSSGLCEPNSARPMRDLRPGCVL